MKKKLAVSVMGVLALVIPLSITPASALTAPINPTYHTAIARGYGVSLWMDASMPTTGYYGGWVWYAKADATPYNGSGPDWCNCNLTNTPPNGIIVTNQVWFTPLGGIARLIATETATNSRQDNGWYPFEALSKYGVLEACCGPGYYTHAFSAAVNNHGPAGPGSVGWGVWVDQTIWVTN